MYEKMFRFTFYLATLSLPFVLSTAQTDYRIKKINCYEVVFQDYCDLVVIVNATFVPVDIWFRNTNNKKEKMDVQNSPHYHVFCDFCKNSSCGFNHTRFCRFQFILRIYMKRKEIVGQYISNIGAQGVIIEHVFNFTNTSPNQPINKTDLYMHIGIGVAVAIFLMFVIVLIVICYRGKKQRSESSKRNSRGRNRHNHQRDEEPSVISNAVSNHTYADIASGIYDGLNPNTLNNKNNYTIPIKNHHYQNVNKGASYLVHKENYTRDDSSSSSDEHSYIEPQQSIEHTFPASISSFEEPEPLAYQITNDFPLSPNYDDSAFTTKTKGPPPPVFPKKSKNELKLSDVNPGPCYDESVIRTKSKGLPVLPKKSTNEPNVSNENPGSSCDINSALRTKTKVPPPVLPKKKNESKLTNLVVPCSSCDINSVLRTKTKGPPPLLPKKKSESKLTNLVVPENVKRKQIVYKKK